MPALPTNPGVIAQPVDGVVAGKPVAGSVLADQPFQVVRLFSGAGAPSSTTLSAAQTNVLTGNGKYLVDDLYQDKSMTPRVLYVCTTAGTNATSVWAQISGGGLSQFKFVSDGGTYYVCHSWDGTTEGTTLVAVAKRHKLRTSLASETIEGVVYNYSYAQVNVGGVTVSYTRSTSGGATQTDKVTPPYLAGDIVLAMPLATGLMAGADPVIWQDMSERAWGKQ